MLLGNYGRKMKFIIRVNADILSSSRFHIWRSTGTTQFNRSNTFSLGRQYSLARSRAFGVVYSNSGNWGWGYNSSLWIL